MDLSDPGHPLWSLIRFMYTVGVMTLVVYWVIRFRLEHPALKNRKCKFNGKGNGKRKKDKEGNGDRPPPATTD